MTKRLINGEHFVRLTINNKEQFQRFVPVIRQFEGFLSIKSIYPIPDELPEETTQKFPTKYFTAELYRDIYVHVVRSRNPLHSYLINDGDTVTVEDKSGTLLVANVKKDNLDWVTLTMPKNYPTNMWKNNLEAFCDGVAYIRRVKKFQGSEDATLLLEVGLTIKNNPKGIHYKDITIPNKADEDGDGIIDKTEAKSLLNSWRKQIKGKGLSILSASRGLGNVPLTNVKYSPRQSPIGNRMFVVKNVKVNVKLSEDKKSAYATLFTTDVPHKMGNIGLKYIDEIDEFLQQKTDEQLDIAKEILDKQLLYEQKLEKRPVSIPIWTYSITGLNVAKQIMLFENQRIEKISKNINSYQLLLDRHESVDLIIQGTFNECTIHIDAKYAPDG